MFWECSESNVIGMIFAGKCDTKKGLSYLIAPLFCDKMQWIVRKNRQMPFRIRRICKMESYKSEFIQFMVDSQVLKFGDFTLKSGRKSPFFMYA